MMRKCIEMMKQQKIKAFDGRRIEGKNSKRQHSKTCENKECVEFSHMVIILVITLQIMIANRLLKSNHDKPQ